MAKWIKYVVTDWGVVNEDEFASMSAPAHRALHAIMWGGRSTPEDDDALEAWFAARDSKKAAESVRDGYEPHPVYL